MIDRCIPPVAVPEWTPRVAWNNGRAVGIIPAARPIAEVSIDRTAPSFASRLVLEPHAEGRFGTCSGPAAARGLGGLSHRPSQPGGPAGHGANLTDPATASRF